MTMMFQPKCLLGKAVYVTHDKFVRPCCHFLDHGWESNSGPNELTVQMHQHKVTWLRSESTNLNNFNNINEILEGKEYQEFFQTISDAADKNDTSNLPPKCISTCYSPSPIIEVDKINEKKPWQMGSKTLPKYLKGPYSGTYTVQIDLTHRCRLGCPKCQRFVPFGPEQGKRRKFLNEEHTVADIAKIAGDGSQYKYWSLCGSIGDAIYHPHIFDIIKYIKETSNGTINIYTNGSGKTPEWWTELYSILNPKTDDIIFGVDGLADTAHLYRKHINFEQTIAAMQMGADKGFYKNGWHYIIFNFNEHQVEEAELLAKKIGINFLMLKSGRWTGPDDPLLPSKKWLDKSVIERFKL